MAEPYLAIQVVMMPRDTNPHGTIFGGVILSYIDQAGAIGARREVARAGGPLPFLVTVAVNRVEFHQPVLVGDVVRFLTRLVRIGRTSITMHVTVEAERGEQTLQVTEAEVVYVGVDLNSPERRPIPLLPGPGR
jgi:acyl-CoA thioesterase YciA